MIGQNWYLVSVHKGIVLDFLTKADTEERAIESVSLDEQEVYAVQVNWQTMEKLTGCLIPLSASPQSMARGVISFNRFGNTITMV